MVEGVNPEQERMGSAPSTAVPAAPLPLSLRSGGGMPYPTALTLSFELRSIHLL